MTSSVTSKERAGELLQAALSVLADNGGQLAVREVMKRIPERVDLTPHERDRYEKTGYVRWESIIHFYSIDAVKSGWLRKNEGIWYLTSEGKDALRLPAKQFITEAQRKYREWKRGQPPAGEGRTEPERVEAEQEEAVVARQTAFEQAVAAARAELETHITAMDPYAFQDLVAALLRGMGYYTPFVAPQGRDSGIDVIAYRDPLGSSSPRIKVQVKHRNEKVAVSDVRELASLLNKEGDIGLIVSSGGFTSEVATEIRRSARHIEKIDRDDLIRLWLENYVKLADDDKLRMPIRQVAFLAPED